MGYCPTCGRGLPWGVYGRCDPCINAHNRALNAARREAERMAAQARRAAEEAARAADRAARDALERARKAATVMVHNDCGTEVVMYGLQGDKVSIRPGHTHTYNCPGGAWMAMQPKTGRTTILPWIQGGLGGGRGGRHDVSFYFRNIQVDKIRDYLSCNWRDILNRCLEYFKSKLQGLSLSFPSPEEPELKLMDPPKFKKFDPAYESDAANRRDGASVLHNEIHEVRQDFETIRDGIHYLPDGLQEVYEVLNSPNELQEEAKGLKSMIGNTRPVIQRSLQANAITKLLAQLMDPVLRALENSFKSAEDGLRGTDRKLNLSDKKKRVARTREGIIRKKSLWSRMEKINAKLAKAEEYTGKVVAAMVKHNVNTLPSNIDNALKTSRSKLHDVNAYIKPVSLRVGQFKSVSQDIMSSVLGPKRFIVMCCRPITNFYKQTLKPVVDKCREIMESIMNLPVIGHIMRWANHCISWLFDKIMDWTGIRRAMKYLADKLNPFKNMDIAGAIARVAPLPEDVFDKVESFQKLVDFKLVTVNIGGRNYQLPTFGASVSSSAVAQARAEVKTLAAPSRSTSGPPPADSKGAPRGWGSLKKGDTVKVRPASALKKIFASKSSQWTTWGRAIKYNQAPRLNAAGQTISVITVDNGDFSVKCGRDQKNSCWFTLDMLWKKDSDFNEFKVGNKVQLHDANQLDQLFSSNSSRWATWGKLIKYNKGPIRYCADKVCTILKTDPADFSFYVQAPDKKLWVLREMFDRYHEAKLRPGEPKGWGSVKHNDLVKIKDARDLKKTFESKTSQWATWGKCLKFNTAICLARAGREGKVLQADQKDFSIKVQIDGKSFWTILEQCFVVPRNWSKAREGARVRWKTRSQLLRIFADNSSQWATWGSVIKYARDRRLNSAGKVGTIAKVDNGDYSVEVLGNWGTLEMFDFL